MILTTFALEAVKNKQFLKSEFNDISYELDRRGHDLKILNKGNFGLVLFGTTPQGDEVVIKIYHEQDAVRETIYQRLTRYLTINPNPYFVPATYHNDGINIDGDTYPVLMMQRVRGKSLGYYIEQCLHAQDKTALVSVTKDIIKLAENLNKNGIAHRDIHPSNIIINEQNHPILIDYDDVWVNGHVEIDSPTKGNREYQHPLRMQQSSFRGDYFDNFGFGIIYIQLQLFLNTLEHHQNRVIDDNFLFTSADFQNIEDSKEIIWYAKGNKTRYWMAILINDLIHATQLSDIPPLTQKAYNAHYMRYASPSWQRSTEFFCPKDRVFF